MRLLLILCLFICTMALQGEEVFELKDGRTLTGTYDPDSETLTFAVGKATASIKVKPSAIISRRLVSDAGDDDGLEDLLILTDGRELRGQYDAKAGSITLSGKVVATIKVAAEDVVKHRRVPPLVEQNPKQKRQKWLMDQLSEMHEGVREAKGNLVLLADRRKKAEKALHLAEKDLAADTAARDTTRTQYQEALTVRDEAAADRSKPVPEALQDRVRELEQAFKNLRVAVAQGADTIDGLEKDLKAMAADADALQARIRSLEDRITKFNEAMVNEQ